MIERVTWRRLRGIAGAALVAAMTLVTLPTALTASAAELQWHLDELGFSELHAQGTTGEGVTIAITESAIDLDDPSLQGADIEYVPLDPACEPIREHVQQNDIHDLEGNTYEDVIRHGTNVAAQIVGQGGEGRVQGVAPDAKLIVFELPFVIKPEDPAWPADCDPDLALGSGRLIEAERRGADIFSTSVVGGGEANTSTVAYWGVRGKAYVTSAGNSEVVTTGNAGLHGVVTTTATKPGSGATDWAARGPEVSIGAPGESLLGVTDDGSMGEIKGTSFSAPIVAGTLALAKQEWPEATYNQLIQSMMHHTKGANGSLNHTEELGYGALDVRAFVAADPAGYPDEPFVYENGMGYDPDWQEVRGLCDGMPSDQTLAYADHYKQDAGMDPDAIEWLPQVAEDEGWVGTAPDAGYWDNPDAQGSGESGSEAEGGASGGDTSASDSDDDGGALVLPLVLGGIGMLLIAAVITGVVLARRGKRAPTAARGPQPPHQYAQQPPMPNGYQRPPHGQPDQQVPTRSQMRPYPPNNVPGNGNGQPFPSSPSGEQTPPNRG